VTHPCDLLFGEGDINCCVGRITGTFTGPLELPDGTVIQPTGRSYDLLFTTAATWRGGGKIVEEYLFYDTAMFNNQVGLGDVRM
jgi:hypothetical protein